MEEPGKAVPAKGLGDIDFLVSISRNDVTSSVVIVGFKEVHEAFCSIGKEYTDGISTTYRGRFFEVTSDIA